MTGEKEVLDVIREVINIGIGEAASALSDLVKKRVYIRVPDIHIMDITEVSDYIANEIGSLSVYISQDFHGQITGKALLAYSRECSVALVNFLYGKTKDISSLTQTDIATLQEIGNIIMVTCISAISNIIEGSISFSMPQVTLEASNKYFNELVKPLEEYDKCVIIKNEIMIKEINIQGYIFILLTFNGFQSITEKLLNATI